MKQAKNRMQWRRMKLIVFNVDFVLRNTRFMFIVSYALKIMSLCLIKHYAVKMCM